MLKALKSIGENMEEKTYRIGEVAERLQLKSYVLRFWETEFSQLTPLRTEKGQRLYTEAHVTLLQHIKRLLHEKGMTIDGARRMLQEELNRAQEKHKTGASSHSKAVSDDPVLQGDDDASEHVFSEEVFSDESEDAFSEDAFSEDSESFSEDDIDTHSSDEIPSRALKDNSVAVRALKEQLAREQSAKNNAVRDLIRQQIVREQAFVREIRRELVSMRQILVEPEE